MSIFKKKTLVLQGTEEALKELVKVEEPERPVSNVVEPLKEEKKDTPSSEDSTGESPPIITMRKGVQKRKGLVTGLHPLVADALSSTINEAKARGLRVALFCGLRKPETQDALYAQGRTVEGKIVTKAKAWESWHNYGLAVDIVFKDKKGNWSWANGNDWKGLGTVGKMFTFEWGGDWKNFPDRPHFQKTGKIQSIREAKEILLNEGLEELWKLV